MILIALRWTAGPLAIVLIGGAVWLWSRPLASVDDVATTTFIRQFSLKSIPDGQLLNNTITIASSRGIYIDFEWAAGKAPPTLIEDHEVTDPFYWTIGLVVYPRKRSLFRNDESWMSGYHVNSYLTPKHPRDRDKKWPMAPGFQGPPFHYGRSSGYKGAPKLRLFPSPQDEFRAWTFLTVPNGTPGDYVYELRLFPAPHRISAVRGETGPSLVFKRGLLRVLPDSAVSVPAGA